MCNVAQALITVRGIVRSQEDKGAYGIVREQIGNCLEEMAKYCDTAPSRLIGGDVEGIMRNYSHWEINLQEN